VEPLPLKKESKKKQRKDKGLDIVAVATNRSNKRIYTLSGIAGCLVAYVAIGLSISLSPWFSWHTNALSDLGHSAKSEVAPIFNVGLLLAGFLFTVYAATVLNKHAKYTSFFVAVSAFFLQLIATFDEVYGFLHLIVSVLFFASIGIVSIVYAAENKSFLGLAAFIVSLLSWLLYELGIYRAGIAVPETVSSLVVALLLASSSFKIFSAKVGRDLNEG
jgi:hypothetical membrane protein